MDFSERLRALREKKNVSQVHMSKILQISRQAYNNYERAIREPGIKNIKKLVTYFDVSADYLLGITDDMIPLQSTKMEK